MATQQEIEEALAVIRNAWGQQPQLRLCQLLSNVAISNGWMSDDLYYLSDKELVSNLKAHVRNIKEKNKM